MQSRSTIKTQFKCHHSQRHFLFWPNKVKCFFSTYDPDSFTVKAILHWIIISSYPPIGYKLRAGSAVYMCVCVCVHMSVYMFFLIGKSHYYQINYTLYVNSIYESLCHKINLLKQNTRCYIHFC